MNIGIGFPFYVVILTFFMGITPSWSQSVVPIGKGSYAAYPPSHEGDKIVQFATNPEIYVLDEAKNLPLPTNDWWTYTLTHRYGGECHVYPWIVDFRKEKPRICRPVRWNNRGNDVVREFYWILESLEFRPSGAYIKKWHDWGVVVRLPDQNRYLDITMVQGVPFLWFEINGWVPEIQWETGGVTFFDQKGNPLMVHQSSNSSFSVEVIGITYGSSHFGLHLPPNSLIALSEKGCKISVSKQPSYFVLSALSRKEDLALFHTYAYAKPVDTQFSFSYQPEVGEVKATFQLITENLKKASQLKTIQGFLPHHYKHCRMSFSWESTTREYFTPRGMMKTAIGDRFEFSYPFKGLLPNLFPPRIKKGESVPFNPSIMATLLEEFAGRSQYGRDTYWGGKDVLNYAKYAHIAFLFNHPTRHQLIAKSKEILTNWLSYAPGETEHYFAWYPAWGGLVGFNPSYGSEFFTDQHFHFGYFVYAAALLGMIDRDFLKDYREMITLVAKSYANWDRSDQRFPYFRTWNIWRGHSYAGGTGSATGNNQESTSEAIQSWAGLFFLGTLLQDPSMMAAGAIGWTYETRAALEYWFDWEKQNLPPNYGKSMVGILWDGGHVYGTYFSGNPLHIHGIQYLPGTPAFTHFTWNPDWTRREYQAMQQEVLQVQGWRDEKEYGGDWANVALQFKLMVDPTYVTEKFVSYWDNRNQDSLAAKVVQDKLSGITYFMAHAMQNLGLPDFKFHTNFPMSQVFYHPEEKVYTIVVMNVEETPIVGTLFEGNRRILSWPITVGVCQAYSWVPGSSPIPIQEIPLLPSSPPNLAIRKRVVASSIQSPETCAEKAVDGDPSTRWSSAFSDPQWITVDLGSSCFVDKVELLWEAAYGKRYEIQISQNSQDWEVVFKEEQGRGGKVEISIQRETRYLRMYGKERGTSFGYSLWEFKVFGGK